MEQQRTTVAEETVISSTAVAGKVERLPDGRPRATRRQAKRKQPPPAAADRRERTVHAVEALAVTTMPEESTFVRRWMHEALPKEAEWRQTSVAQGPPGGISLLRMPPPMLLQLEQFGPLIRRADAIQSTTDVLTLFNKKYGKRRTEFGLSPIYAPPLIAHLAQFGVFPMTIPLGEHLRIMAFKCHEARAVSVLRPSAEQDSLRTLLPRDAPPLRAVPGASRVAKRCLVVVDQHWEAVRLLVRQEHGVDWLTPELELAFRHMHLHPTADRAGMRLHCVAILAPVLEEDDQEDEDETLESARYRVANGLEVVAGEFGYTVGSCYTSLTGAFRKVDGSGTVQLAMVQALLYLSGFELWDLGMTMRYKEEALGTVEVPRRRWVELAAAVAGRRPSPPPDNGAVQNARQQIARHRSAVWSAAGGLPDTIGATTPLAELASTPLSCAAVLRAFREACAAAPTTVATSAVVAP